uniref:Aminopeptidase N-like N-terminal domain-containing protein n=1 Tax=Megaselia scalaris TaxID=36166 RepID=T1GW69_MEGSC
MSIACNLPLTAFTVSTIVLAVQKANLESDLDAAQKKLDAFEEALQNTTPGVQTTHSSSESPSTESSSTTTENTPEVPQEIDYRLPKSVEPTHYDLYLHPNLDSNEFEGQIVIKLKILENTDKIILHSSGLDISSVYFNNYKHSVESYSFDTARDFLIVKSTKELSSGSDMTLGILFSGKQMDTKIVGLYTSAYKKIDGSMK